MASRPRLRRTFVISNALSSRCQSRQRWRRCLRAAPRSQRRVQPFVTSSSRSSFRRTWPRKCVRYIESSAAATTTRPRCGGTQQCDGRGPAGRKLRGSARAVPQHRRRGCADRELPSLLRVLVYRSRHQLSRANGLRTPEGRSVRRCAAHGALGPRVRRRHVLD